MKYAWVDAHRKEFELAEMCEVLAVSVSGYRAWKRGGTPERKRLTDAQMLALICAIHAELKGAYGSPRITEELRARPVQAALASAAAFTVGALLPIATTVLAPAGKVAMVTTAATLVGLLLSGGLAARVGGAPVLRGAWRVGFWGAMAMGAAALVGRLFHVSI